MKKLLLSAAIAGAVTAANSAPEAALAAGDKEKCYGVAAAGQNHCASADGSHACAGQAKKDNDPNEWKYVEKGTCEEMGGSLKPGAHGNSCEGKNGCEGNSCEGKNGCEGNDGEESDHGHDH